MYVKNYKSIRIRTCRVCLVTELTNCVLLDYNDEWRQMLEFCVGISIHKQEEPRMLCTKCLNILWNYFKFKKQCLVSDELWKSLAYDRVSCSVEKCKVNIETDSESDWVDVERLSDDAEVNCENETSNSDIYNSIENCFTDESFILYVHADDKNDFHINEIVNDNNDAVNNSLFEEHKKTNILSEVSKENVQTQKVDVDQDITKTISSAKKLKPKVRKSLYPRKMKSDGSIIYGCGLCKFTATSPRKISHHFQEHVLKNDLKCQICDFVGHDFADSVAHRLSHSAPEFVVVGCPVCMKVFRANMSLQFHYRSVHMNMSGGYCVQCNRSFKQRRDWSRHAQLHAAGRKLICDICGAKFRLKTHIKEHIMLHNDIYPFVCHLCGRKFKRMSLLKCHLANLHDTQAVKCTVCNRTYKNKKKLEHHMKYTHTRKLQCELCGKHFGITPHHLKIHNLIWHSDERPYKCGMCEKRFKLKSNLNEHLKTHYKHKSHQCEICNRNLTSASSLKRHEAVHTGIRSCQCTFCDRSFYWTEPLRKHCLKIHKVDITVERRAERAAKLWQNQPI